VAWLDLETTRNAEDSGGNQRVAEVFKEKVIGAPHFLFPLRYPLRLFAGLHISQLGLFKRGTLSFLNVVHEFFKVSRQRPPKTKLLEKGTA
jgi:hypothetical protein